MILIILLYVQYQGTKGNKKRFAEPNSSNYVLQLGLLIFEGQLFYI